MGLGMCRNVEAGEGECIKQAMKALLQQVLQWDKSLAFT